MTRQFPAAFSVPNRFRKHLMVVVDLDAGDAGAIEDSLLAAWELQHRGHVDPEGLLGSWTGRRQETRT